MFFQILGSLAARILFFNISLLGETARRGARTRLLLTSAAVFALLIPSEHDGYIYF